MCWTKYVDSSQHKLKPGQVYRVKTNDGYEMSARFWVYDGGFEVDFLLVQSGLAIDVAEIYL